MYDGVSVVQQHRGGDNHGAGYDLHANITGFDARDARCEASAEGLYIEILGLNRDRQRDAHL